MNKWVEYGLLLIIAFTIPTLAVASKWGAQEQMFEHIIERLEKMDNKLDKVDTRLWQLKEEN